MPTNAPDELVKRALHEVFGERDASKRRAKIAELFTDDCLFVDHSGESRGHDEVDRAAQARLADFVFSERQPAERLHSAARLKWEFGLPGAPVPSSASMS